MLRLRCAREHLDGAVDADPAAVRQVARQLALAAAHVEHGQEPLLDEASGDAPVDVRRARAG
jgi:hypothetical protein